MNVIGIRKEEKPFEARVPIIPAHIDRLSSDHGLSFVVEPSTQRAFPVEEFSSVNALVSPLIDSKASIILGIKEMPMEFFEPSKVYMFFSHVTKGQTHNMPMLRRVMDVGATLIDYEHIVDDKGKRLVFFGNWAGMAGISDTLRALGERLKYENVAPNPFAEMRETRKLRGLPELKQEFKALADRISDKGLPKDLLPFVVGFAGYGNVSKGAQELFDILPHEVAQPHELPSLKSSPNTLYKCVFKEEDMVEPINPSNEFDLQDYYNHGSVKYHGTFQRHVPYLTVLVNCIYWSAKYPRLLTKEFIKSHWRAKNRRLRVIGDISCDIQGGIEFTLYATNPAQPTFTYLVDKDVAVPGVMGDGPVVMAVDNLPCELPRESSTSFSSSLLGFVPALANADFSVPFEKLSLPRELKDAVIVYRGQLTPRYQYLQQFLQ